MLKEIRYALDFMFIFMLFVSVIVFGLDFLIPVDDTVSHTVEYLDLGILAGYYFFFTHGLVTARHKFNYVKQHWIMLLLLLVPFVPLARLLRLHQLEKIFGIGTNTLWHLFDEFGLL